MGTVIHTCHSCGKIAEWNCGAYDCGRPFKPTAVLPAVTKSEIVQHLMLEYLKAVQAEVYGCKNYNIAKAKANIAMREAEITHDRWRETDQNMMQLRSDLDTAIQEMTHGKSDNS